MRKFLSLAALAALCSCAVAPPGPEIFESAERAIENAERAGAEELSPVELKFAREMLDELLDFDGRMLPSVLTMSQKNKKGYVTTIRYLNISFDVNLSKNTFTLRNLQKRR